MFNKVILSLVILALIISVGVFFLELRAQDKTEKIFEGLEEFHQKISREVELISQKVPPYIPTGEAAGFVVEFENGTKLYFASDTGLMSDMELIGKYFKPEIAFLPIGNIYTMDSKAAGFAAELINPDYIIPTNYGGFPELEPNPERFLEELKNYKLKGKALVFEIGETQEVLGVKILWLGGKNWLLEGPRGTRILINPGIRYNLDFPREYQDLVQFKRIDLVLIPGGRFDNFTLSDTRKWGQLFDPLFVCPYELGIWLKSQLPNYKILALDQGGRIGISEMRRLGIPEKNLEKIKLKAINLVSASHCSSVTPEGSRE